MSTQNKKWYEYSSNNSGGNWWLSDENWKQLEEEGWFVIWGGLYFCNSKDSWSAPPAGAPTCTAKQCHGHRRYNSYEAVVAAGDGVRWLGALARDAWKKFHSEGEAIAEWERITGQNVEDEGCSCCGSPHSIHEGYRNEGPPLDVAKL